MKLKVVDTSSLKTPQLEQYLTLSPENKVVLVEPVNWETFKGGRELVGKNFRILSLFNKQVIVLRGNSRIWKLHPRENGLRRRLQCERTTKQFGGFLSHLYDSRGLKEFESHIDSLEVTAQQTVDDLIPGAGQIRTGIAKLAEQCSPQERKSWRERPLQNAALVQKLFMYIAETAMTLIMETGSDSELPTYKEAIFSLQFRFAACGYMLAMNKVSNGGFEETPLERVRNDWTDMLIAAYATFFDGIITEDKNQNEAYLTAKKFLSYVIPKN